MDDMALTWLWCKTAARFLAIRLVSAVLGGKLAYITQVPVAEETAIFIVDCYNYQELFSPYLIFHLYIH